MVNDLNAAGAKVFELLYRIMLKNRDSDRVVLHHKMTKLPKAPLSAADRPVKQRGPIQILCAEPVFRQHQLPIQRQSARFHQRISHEG